MRIIPTRLHGVMDYLVAIVLIALPAFPGFPLGLPGYVPIGLGVATIVYSLLTNYERGLAKLIPMRAHLLLDLLNGALLASSPWLFGFADEIWKPHLILGCMELGVVALSSPVVPVSGRMQQA